VSDLTDDEIRDILSGSLTVSQETVQRAMDEIDWDAYEAAQQSYERETGANALDMPLPVVSFRRKAKGDVPDL